jgi:hypothetical protein
LSYSRSFTKSDTPSNTSLVENFFSTIRNGVASFIFLETSDAASQYKAAVLDKSSEESSHWYWMADSWVILLLSNDSPVFLFHSW